MPIKECTLPSGGKGFQWGDHGTCYADRKDAEHQAEAAHANGFTGDMALDASARTISPDGHLHISKSHISKAAVNPYYGREIPDRDHRTGQPLNLGLDPDRIYYLLRDPVELAKAAPTFAGKPILSKHVPVSADNHPTELVVGAIGSEVEFSHPYLDADLSWWTSESIAGIETKQVRELSCAYRYVPVMVPGIFEGQSYDGVMTNIIGNHLAQVESGRAGSDVFAADSQLEKPEMKMTKMGKALFVALGGISPKLAQDSSLAALVGELTPKTLKASKAEIMPKLIAMDAEAKEKAETVMDGFEAEEEPKAEEPKKPAKDKKAKDSKKGKDSKPEGAEDDDEEDEDEAPAQDEEKDKKALDEFKKELQKELRDADEARRAVRPIVGEMIAQDSAEEIYGFALDQMKVERKGVKELPALKALFTLASANASKAAPVTIAQDSAGVAKMFPNASRFTQG